MPGIVLHTLFAERAIPYWPATSLPDVDFGDPGVAAAYYRGAISPDMGYFPGGEIEISKATHSRTTEAIAAALLDGARDSRQRAFALGWLTHVIADCHLHPHIDHAAAIGIQPNGVTTPRTAADHLAAHIRVELALEMQFLRDASGRIGRVWRNNGLCPSYAHLANALRLGSGRTLSMGQLARSDLAMSAFVEVALRYTRLLIRASGVWRPAPGQTRDESKLKGSIPSFPLPLPLDLGPTISYQLTRRSCELMRDFPELVVAYFAGEGRGRESDAGAGWESIRRLPSGESLRPTPQSNRPAA